MTTIASKVCHHCCNLDHLDTCFFAGGSSGALGSFLGAVTACFVKPTLTGILSGALGGGAIGACAGASAVTTYFAKCQEESGGSNIVVYYDAQPSIPTRVVSKQPSSSERGYGFNPHPSYYYESYSGHAFECSNGDHSGGHSGCSDGGGSGDC